MEGLAGFRKCNKTVVNHAPDIAEHDIDTVHEIAQLLGKAESCHRLDGRSARRPGSASRQCCVTGGPWRTKSGIFDGSDLARAIGVLRLARRGCRGSRCPLRPQRPGWCKQEPLAEPLVIDE